MEGGMHLIVKGWYAGILVFETKISEDSLDNFLLETKGQLQRGELTVVFAMSQRQVVSEMCIDVYDKDTGKYLPKKSVAYKR